MPMPAHPMCARSEWDDAQRMRLNDVQPCLRVQRLHLLVAADAVTCVTAELLGAAYVVVDGRHTEAAQTMIDRPRPRRACEEGAPARGVGPPRVPSTDATHGGGGVGGGTRARDCAARAAHHGTHLETVRPRAESRRSARPAVGAPGQTWMRHALRLRPRRTGARDAWSRRVSSEG